MNDPLMGRDRFMSGFDPTLDPRPIPFRRLEVITGIGGRRRWSEDAKAEIMMEALQPGARVSEVARRHDLRPQQLFGWLREARRTAELAPAPMFAPVVLEPAPPVAALVKSEPRALRKTRRSRDGDIELEIDGVTVRVGRDAEAKTVAAVIHALKKPR